MVDRSGEVQDVRNRNRGLKIGILVLIVVLILAGVAAAVYFFVFHDDGKVHLEYEPLPDKNSLIYLNQTEPPTGEELAKKIDNFLEQYTKPPAGLRTACGDNYIKPESEHDIPCAVDVSLLRECSSSQNRYGYGGRAQPCVALRLNKIVGWEPEPYYSTDEEEALARGMPDNLYQQIKLLNQSTYDRNRRLLNTTWLTCEGADKEDKDNIGPLGYYFPGLNLTNIFGGIPNMFFPYLEQEAYLSPFVFVKFLNPKPQVVINVKCRAWAKNIEAGEGVVEFQLKID